MKKTKKGQVELYKLLFTVNWEDPESDYKALRIKPGERIMTITSGACNTLNFLLFDPESIHTVDINPSQSYVLELKIAAMRNLDYNNFLKFLGLIPAGDRNDNYRKLRTSLSTGAADFWDHNINIIENGFLLNGRYDKFVKLLGKIFIYLQGRKKVDELLADKTLEQQKEYFDRAWENRRIKFIFNAFLNKHILARRGLKADYFHFDDGSNSFAESFANKFKKVAREIPVKGNYFLHLYLKGHYRSLEEMPDYLLEKNFDLIKSRLNRIHLVTQDAKQWLAGRPSGSINCFSLSNICELMSLEDTSYTFEQVARCASRDARICFRNLILPRTVPEILCKKIIRDVPLSTQLLKEDRSFVYSRVDAMTVV